MDTIKIVHKIVDISKAKLRHKNASAYPLWKQLFIDRVMQKAEQKTLNEDSYHIMCSLESFIEEMTAVMKKRRRETADNKEKRRDKIEEEKNLLAIKATRFKKRKRQDNVASRRKRHRGNVGM